MFFKPAAYATLSMCKAQEALESDRSIRLIDVRTPYEFHKGHIPESLNLPLNRISEIARLAPEKHTRLFVCCQSGARSRMACARLARLGYSDVTDIGGIIRWEAPAQRRQGV